jgi:hypothetical protein
MKKDAGWNVFFSDEKRYADFINGCACQGQQLVKEEDVQEMDTKLILKLWYDTRNRHTGKFRDMARRVIFGVNFVIIGLESQETKDYSYPVRNMIYDVGEYEKQLRKIRRQVRHNAKGLSAGEYLYGFRSTDRLHPVVTFLLYAGEEPWEKPLDLWDILDFTDIPPVMKQYTHGYKINLIDIRRMADTSVFQTDLRQVFDFIRCSDDKMKLMALVENEPYFQHMEEDAFEVTANYAHVDKLNMNMEEYLEEGGLNMCKAIQELMEDSRIEGYENGRSEGYESGIADGELKGKIKVYSLELHLTPDEIAGKLGVDRDTVNKYM